MGNTLLNKNFVWSILGGLLHACQIVIHSDVLWYFVLGHDFVEFMWNALGLEDIVF